MQGFCASCLSCIMLSQALHDYSHACTWSYVVLTLAALSRSQIMPASSVVPPGSLDVRGYKKIVLGDLRSCSSFAEGLSLLGCCAVLLGLLFVTFRRNVVSPLSGSRSPRTLLGLLDPECEFSVIIQSIRCWALNDSVSLSRSLEFLILCYISCKKLPIQISIIYHVFWQQY